MAETKKQKLGAQNVLASTEECIVRSAAKLAPAMQPDHNTLCET
jgi:hypothetical protein